LTIISIQFTHLYEYLYENVYIIFNTFNNRVSYEELAALIGGLTLIDSRYEYWKFVFRSTLYAQPQTTDLLPGDLHHALFSVQRWLVVIRCLLKYILVFNISHRDRIRHHIVATVEHHSFKERIT